jgi:AraC-like DNA-binding protein
VEQVLRAVRAEDPAALAGVGQRVDVQAVHPRGRRLLPAPERGRRPLAADLGQDQQQPIEALVTGVDPGDDVLHQLVVRRREQHRRPEQAPVHQVTVVRAQHRRVGPGELLQLLHRVPVVGGGAGDEVFDHRRILTSAGTIVGRVVTDMETFQEALTASGLAPVRSGRHDPGQFRAGVVSRDLGPLKIIELRTPEGECFRDARSSRSVDEELWQIELMVRGRARVEQGRGTAELGPSDLVLVDPARPARFASTASTHVSILVPRQELRLRPSDAGRLTGVRIKGDRGPGALVSALARDMVRSLSGFRAGQAERSAAAVIELIAVALEARIYDEARPCPDEALRGRILGYIEARLSERELAPAVLAAAHHISVRRLHKLFEDQPESVAALIRRRRLERCRADLKQSDRTVTAVAARWGFTDPAYFSRLFKATYGDNPAALKSSHRARNVKTPPARPGEDGGRRDTEG